MGEPAVPVTVGKAVEVAVFVNVITEVSEEAVLVLEVVVKKCVVLSTAAVDDAVEAPIADSTVVVVRALGVWEVVARASVLEMGVVGDAVAVVVFSTEVFAYAVVV